MGIFAPGEQEWICAVVRHGEFTPFSLAPKKRPWTVKRKSAWDEQARRLFVRAGVVRIGAAGIVGPVVPAPYPGA